MLEYDCIASLQGKIMIGPIRFDHQNERNGWRDPTLEKNLPIRQQRLKFGMVLDQLLRCLRFCKPYPRPSAIRVVPFLNHKDS
jgi:hypothetical protein